MALLLHNGRKWWQRYGNQEDPEEAFGIYNVSKHFCGTSGSKTCNDGSWQLTGFLFNGEYWHQTPSFAREQLREQVTIIFSAVDVLQSYGRQFPRLTPEKGSVGAPKRRDWMRKVLFHLIWRCSRATSCSPDFPHPLSFLPPVHPSSSPAWGLYQQATVLRDTAQVNRFPAWWQAHTSACKQLNLNAPLQPLQSALSRPWSPTTATRRSYNQ